MSLCLTMRFIRNKCLQVCFKNHEVETCSFANFISKEVQQFYCMYEVHFGSPPKEERKSKSNNDNNKHLNEESES